MSQDEINRFLLKSALSGKHVVRLKGGDPFIFGRGGEEAAFLKGHNVPRSKSCLELPQPWLLRHTVVCLATDSQRCILYTHTHHGST